MYDYKQQLILIKYKTICIEAPNTCVLNMYVECGKRQAERLSMKIIILPMTLKKYKNLCKSTKISGSRFIELIFKNFNIRNHLYKLILFSSSDSLLF